MECGEGDTRHHQVWPMETSNERYFKFFPFHQLMWASSAPLKLCVVVGRAMRWKVLEFLNHQQGRTISQKCLFWILWIIYELKHTHTTIYIDHYLFLCFFVLVKAASVTLTECVIINRTIYSFHSVNNKNRIHTVTYRINDRYTARCHTLYRLHSMSCFY